MDLCCGECHQHPCPPETDKLRLRKLEELCQQGSLNAEGVRFVHSAVRTLIRDYTAKIGEVELLKEEIKQLKERLHGNL